jgi:ABC-type polysaccharide/polyol phosphate transport system ATPase subunit
LPTLPEGSIEVDHVWKRFRADRAHPTFHDQIVGLTKRIRESGPKWRWVLRDVNLHVEPGQTVALIGVNGSGKSTLLKVISQVTYQNAGSVDTHGRIGALLEVRSGIHPDLSGRQNVFLYGAILGLTRKEIAKRFDTIVEFAEVGDAIDRPVKFYSSGMQVRLGFAIAAFLEPAILLVDEVLAVGDASFQHKCLSRISEVVQNGTTLIFVSHDLAAIHATCDRALWLSDSVVRADGPTSEVLSLYRSAVEGDAALSVVRDDGDATLVKTIVEGPGGGQVVSGGDLEVTLVVRMPDEGTGALFLGVSEGTATPVFVLRRPVQFGANEIRIKCTMRHLPLFKGRYSLWVGMRSRGNTRRYISWQPVANFEVYGPLPSKAPNGVMVLSPVHVDADWQIDATWEVD